MFTINEPNLERTFNAQDTQVKITNWNNNIQAKVKSAMDIMCDNLDNSITPFIEHFPNYTPDIPTRKMKIFTYFMVSRRWILFKS